MCYLPSLILITTCCFVTGVCRGRAAVLAEAAAVLAEHESAAARNRKSGRQQPGGAQVVAGSPEPAEGRVTQEGKKETFAKIESESFPTSEFF